MSVREGPGQELSSASFLLLGVVVNERCSDN